MLTAGYPSCCAVLMQLEGQRLDQTDWYRWCLISDCCRAVVHTASSEPRSWTSADRGLAVVDGCGWRILSMLNGLDDRLTQLWITLITADGSWTGTRSLRSALVGVWSTSKRCNAPCCTVNVPPLCSPFPTQTYFCIFSSTALLSYSNE